MPSSSCASPLRHPAEAQPAPRPLSILDVPFISQSEALCGGAAAAMVLRYWGARGLDAESFAPLVDRSAGGIRTTRLDRRSASTGLERGGRRRTGRSDRRGVGSRAARAHADRGSSRNIPLRRDRGVDARGHRVSRSGSRAVSRDGTCSALRADGRRPIDGWPSSRHRGRLVRRSHRPLPTCPTPPRAEGSSPPVCSTRRRAQFGAAEQSLTAALSCGGAAPFRELAGLRLLQRRWPEVGELARRRLWR